MKILSCFRSLTKGAKVYRTAGSYTSPARLIGTYNIVSAMDTRAFSSIDLYIGEIDKAIKVLSGLTRSSRSPPAVAEAQMLPQAQRVESARLMRVNHSGEVAAQALYQGQAFTARDKGLAAAMRHAAAEEADHLAWCAARLTELK